MSRRTDTYRGYEIRHRRVRDGDGFNRYDAEIRVSGEWVIASPEALDDETIYRDLDAFIERLAPAHFSRQARLPAQNGTHIWSPKRCDKEVHGNEEEGMNANPSTDQARGAAAQRAITAQPLTR